MATIKSFTDISQSRKLSEILPLESADMYYGYGKDKPEFLPYSDVEIKKLCLSCWSLAALLEILDKSAYSVNEAGIVELLSVKATKGVIILNCGKIEDCYADNPIDACVAMIEKLYELKLL